MDNAVLIAPRPRSHRTAEENLGLGYLAAALRKGDFQVRIVDAWLEDLDDVEVARRVVQPAGAAVVGISAYRSGIEAATKLMILLRSWAPGVPVVAGGFGPTFHADDFLEVGFDFVMRGEADNSVLPLFRGLARGSLRAESIPGLSYKSELGQVKHNPLGAGALLDSLPHPARDTLDSVVRRRTPAHVMTSRGCMANCTFCSVVAFEGLSRGPMWRARSLPDIVSELKTLADAGISHIKVIDDSFIEPPRAAAWATELADRVEDAGLRMVLRGSIRADRVDEELVAELSRAGFVSFSCGVENFAPSALRRMSKSATVEDNERALAAFAKHDIVVQAGHILFDHATTMSELLQNLAGFKRHSALISKGTFSEMYAATGTKFTRRVQRLGLIVNSEATSTMNSSYRRTDPEVEQVYQAMKRWHTAHMFVYDMTIDPLSAPKALSREEMEEFHALANQLRARDIATMEGILMTLGGARARTEFVESEIDRLAPWYADVFQQVERLYTRVGLTYEAEANPFMSQV